MRLASYIPRISSDIVTALNAVGIRTDTDVLCLPLSELCQRLPAFTRKQLREFVHAVSALSAPPGRTAMDLLLLDSDESLDTTTLETGVAHIDTLLGGGFSRKHVYEVSGDTGSGKTSLALNLVLRHLSLQPSSSALWIDTIGAFSAERATKIVSKYTKNSTLVLDRLHVSLAFDVGNVLSIVHTLESHLSSPNLSCIIIDAITPLLAPLFSAVSSHGHAIMTDMMRQLRNIASRRSLTIIESFLNVINNSTSSHVSDIFSIYSAHTGRKPSLGPSFTFLTDATIWLARNPRKGEELSDTSADPEQNFCMRNEHAGALDTDALDKAEYTFTVLRSRLAASQKSTSFFVQDDVLVQ
ncbi:P-loop containing nucleoside triphosphate hydrolase protein [Fistulina hepatica ATCC 64428]|nr:P-loop containing nucleoside triphosphate hydrolase protein [Fistulina hepatica ATCC 64428]